MGRPCKLSPEIQDRLCQALRSGNTREDSATYAGISPATFFAWMNKAKEQATGQFLEFSEAVKKAEADCAVRNVAVIQKAATGGQLTERKTVTKKGGTTEVTERFSAGEWQAAAWWLERRRPDDFGRRERHEHTGDKGGPVQITTVEVVRPREMTTSTVSPVAASAAAAGTAVTAVVVNPITEAQSSDARPD